jgi:hypothetical protein
MSAAMPFPEQVLWRAPRLGGSSALARDRKGVGRHFSPVANVRGEVSPFYKPCVTCHEVEA